ncbi:MAG: ATP-binding protein [Saprospiraceae bacterium]
MASNFFIALRNFFVPKEHVVNASRQLHVLIYFYILTACFTTSFVLFYILIQFEEGMVSLGLTTLLFFIGLILIKQGMSLTFLSHFFLFSGAIVGIIITTYFTGGLYSPVMPWFVAIPIASLLLFDSMKDMMIWIVIAIIGVTAFIILALMKVNIAHNYNLEWKEWHFGISYMGLTLIIFFLSFVFKRFIIEKINQLQVAQIQLLQSEKLASLGELTAGIAHEIQNPLNFVNNFSEISVELIQDLQEEIEKQDPDKEYINELFLDLSQNQEKIHYHGTRASNIVISMLQHSRARSDIKEYIDINTFVGEFLRLSYHGLRANDKSFNAEYKLISDPNLPKIFINSQDFGRVLLNLINNAFYAVKERKKISIDADNQYNPTVIISTEMIENKVVVKIKDNGVGIPESIKAKIFQPFFTTKPTGHGTGLGLSLSYDIITNGHGGTIDVVSQEGEYTEIVITLPLTK